MTSAAAGSVQARVYSLSQQEARDAPDVVTSTCSVFEQSCRVLFDSGASHSFISEDFVKCLPASSVIVSVVPGLSVLLLTGDRSTISPSAPPKSDSSAAQIPTLSLSTLSLSLSL